jgi:hypothetical protein
MPEDWYFAAQRSLERQQMLRADAREAHRIRRAAQGKLRRALAQRLIRLANRLVPEAVPSASHRAYPSR